MKHLKVVITLLIAGLISVISTSLAQETSAPTSLGVSPAIMEQILEPGNTITTKVTVFNTTNIPLPIKGNVRSFLPNETITGDLENNELFDASNWIKLEPTDFIIQPKEEKEIEVTIETPVDADPGGHYATIFFQPLIPAEYISAGNTMLTARVGIITLFNVKGDVVEKAEISEFNSKPIYQKGPVNFNFIVKNTGNVHLLTSGKLIIKNKSGTETTEIKLDPFVIIPNTERPVSASWDKEWGIGKYSAQVQLNYGSENSTILTEPTDFWIMPYMLIITIFISLTVLLFLIIILRKRFLRAFNIIFKNEYENTQGGDKF